jgi:hypothetical protein
MDTIPEKSGDMSKGTPVWLKRLLIALLFISAAAGFIFSSSILLKSTSGLFKTLGKKPAIENNINHLQSFFEAAAPSTTTNIILCQGIIITRDRGPLAIINGKPAKTGTVINGVRILEITANNVRTEYNGKIRGLKPGESFIPKK